jgi:hypothetical protein
MLFLNFALLNLVLTCCVMTCKLQMINFNPKNKVFFTSLFDFTQDGPHVNR